MPQPIGYLLQIATQVFACPECAPGGFPPERYTDGCEEFVPTPINVYEENIRPYSQTCHLCNRLVVDGIKKTGTDEPLCLFD